MINTLDIALVILVIIAAAWGARHTLSRQLMVSAGALIGVFAAVALYGRLAFLTEQSSMRAAVLSALALAAGFLSYDVVLNVGNHIQRRYPSLKQRAATAVSRFLSTSIAGLTCLSVAWLMSVTLSTSQTPSIRQQIEGSRIFSFLNKSIEAPPMFRRVAHLLEPFSSPQVFVGADPVFETSAPIVTKEFANLDAATMKARASTVKVSAWGCGSTSVGSGFLVDKALIVTNAHVVTGASRTSIENARGTFATQTVWFDPRLDIAILKTAGTLSEEPLALRKGLVPAGTLGSMLGYPAGGGLATSDAIVLQSLNAAGYDIYDQAKVDRQIYAFRASVVPGNSGGPLIDASGKVMGLIFGDSTAQARTGYAITADQVAVALATATKQNSVVSNGQCSSS